MLLVELAEPDADDAPEPEPEPPPLCGLRPCPVAPALALALPEAPPAPCALSTSVVDLPTLTTNEDSPEVPLMYKVVTPVGRPAGTVALGGSEVIAAGCEVTAVGSPCRDERCPVIMPAEFVSVRSEVAGFEY